MKPALLITLLAMCVSAYAATIPADKTKTTADRSDDSQDALKKSYELLEKLLLGSKSALTDTEMESLEESLKALATLQSDLDPEGEGYFLAQLFQKAISWAIQQGVSKAVARGVEKAINRG